MNSVTLTFAANGQQLVRTGCEKFAANTVNYIQAKFDLGEGWDGFDSVRAVWQTDFVKIATVLDNDGNCTVPQEVLKRVNSIMVNLVGSISDGTELTDRLTTYKVKALDVNGATNIDGTETTEVTPSQFEQFVDIVEDEVAKVTGMTAEATTLPSGSDATASYSDGVLTLGIPKGDRGEEGPIGPQGPQGEVGPEGPQGPKGEDAVVPWDDILPTDTASGAVASFPDGSDLAPAKSLKVSLDPIQDLHGYDSPWVGGAGKNKIDVADGTCTTTTTLVTKELTAGTYTFSAYGKRNDGGSWRVLVVDENNVSIESGTNTSGSTLTRCHATFTVSATTTVKLQLQFLASYDTLQYERVQFEVGALTDYAPYTNICQISGRTEVEIIVSPTTEAEDGESYTTDLGQTVYGGTLDVVSGELVVNRAMVTYDGSADENWKSERSGNWQGVNFYTPLPTGMTRSTNGVLLNITDKVSVSYIQDGLFISASYLNFLIGQALGITDVAVFRTWLLNNPIQLSYPLATTQTYQLTPQEVQTLLGQNNVWSEQGSVEVVYKADIQRWVEKKLA